MEKLHGAQMALLSLYHRRHESAHNVSSSEQSREWFSRNAKYRSTWLAAIGRVAVCSQYRYRSLTVYILVVPMTRLICTTNTNDHGTFKLHP